MLTELFQYVRNPGSKYARKLGYSQELIAIEARYKRNKRYWQTHLENSRNVMIQASNLCAEKNTVMVLGAGLTLDVPLEFLANNFKHVYLVDIVFSSQSKKACKPFKNVKPIVHDLNGLENQLTGVTDLKHPPVIQATLPTVQPAPDLVISANILSQLHLAPIYFLEKKYSLSDEQLATFARQVIDAHIALLKSQASQVCLITDYYRFTTGNKSHREMEEALLGAELPVPDKSWMWRVAPKGELDKRITMETEVFAYYNFI